MNNCEYKIHPQMLKVGVFKPCWFMSIMLVVTVNGNTYKSQHGQLGRVKQSLQINT